MKARLLYTAPALPFPDLTELIRYLGLVLVRLFFVALIQVLIPAAILRGLLGRDWQRITWVNALAFGILMSVLIALFITGLFSLASIIQPGSVARGYIFTWNDFFSALTLGLAACLGVMLGKALRVLQ